VSVSLSIALQLSDAGRYLLFLYSEMGWMVLPSL
jgi:hypothetical protein